MIFLINPALNFNISYFDLSEVLFWLYGVDLFFY